MRFSCHRSCTFESFDTLGSFSSPPNSSYQLQRASELPIDCIIILEMSVSLSTQASRRLRTGSCIPRKAYGRFEFLVCDWSLMKRMPGEKVTSQTFLMEDSSEWALEIYLDGKTERQAGFLTTEVVLNGVGENDGDELTATVTLSILYQNGHHVHDRLEGSVSYRSNAATKFRTDDPLRRTWAVDNFMQSADLERDYVVNDAVLFALDIEVLGRPSPFLTTMPAYVGHVSNLQQDMRAVMHDKDLAFSDITLVMEGRKFPCHKCILAARSEVFKKKFSSSTFPAKMFMSRGEYQLAHLNCAIFEHILLFMYTDECSEEVLAAFCCSILVVAVQLKIPKLVTICEDYIGETLTPDKVAGILNLAVDVQSERLDSCCSDFIAAHVNNVMATKTLKNLRPQALKNLITRSVIPASSLLIPSASPAPSPTAGSIGGGFNTSFMNRRKTSIISRNSADEDDEEVKDPMVSRTVPSARMKEEFTKTDKIVVGGTDYSVPSGESKGAEDLPHDKLREMTLHEIAENENAARMDHQAVAGAL